MSAESSVSTDLIASIDISPERAEVRFVSGSTLSVPRNWSERITDLVPRGNVAEQMSVAHGRLASVADPVRIDYGTEPCRQLEDIRVNEVFYQALAHRLCGLSCVAP
jgi:hypothetical protein